MTVVWLALAVSLVAVVVAAVMAVRRGLTLYRDARRFSGAAADELASVERRTAEIERHLDAAAASGEALSAAAARLAASRARLNVMLAAIDDVRASVSRVTAYMPRK